MASFTVLNRSPDGSTYFAQEGTFNWTYASVVEMYNDSLYSDYITLDLGTSAAGFPHLYARLYGNFTFANGYNSDSQIIQYVKAGSIITSCSIIDASGKIYDQVDGLNFALNSDKTTVALEAANIFANSFRPGESPVWTTVYAGNDYLTGNSGTEVLQGLGGNDTLIGGGGSDGLLGGDGNDSLVGGDGADDLLGEAGNDIIAGYTAGDYVDGGLGFDTWALTGTYTSGLGLQPKIDLSGVSFYNMEAVRITYGDFVFNQYQIGGGSPVQTVIGGSSYRDAFTVAAISPGGGQGAVVNLATVTFQNWNVNTQDADFITITGTDGGDTVDGSSQSDSIYAYGGNNLVRAGQGNDMVVALDGNDTLRGGAGSDALTGYGGNDILIGDDALIGPAYMGGDDTLTGGAGNDTLMGLEGWNILNGGDGVDTADYGFEVVNGPLLPVTFYMDLSVVVTPGSDLFNASAWVNYGDVTIPQCHDQLIGIENIDGSRYMDVMTGDAQANRLFGWDGNDSIFGGAGNDALAGGNGNDTLNGGDGIDALAFLYSGTGVVANLTTGTASGEGSDLLSGIEYLIGSAYNDVLTGDGNANWLEGGAGDDNLFGGLKSDTLTGGLGNDTLAGGQGMDSIRGGDGNDIIKGALGTDTLTGGAGADHFQFTTTLDGLLNIDTITDFTSGQDVIDLSASVFTAFAGQAGAHVGLGAHLKYNAASGALAYDVDGNGAGAAVTFAILGTVSHPATLGSDFVIVA